MFTKKSLRQPTELEFSVVTGLLLRMRWCGRSLGLRRTRFALISSAAAALMRPRTICASGITSGEWGMGVVDVDLARQVQRPGIEQDGICQASQRKVG